MAAARKADYACIEADWRAGLLSIQQLADLHQMRTGVSVTHTAVNKYFKTHNIPRDLAAKIRARAEAKVEAAMVSRPKVLKRPFKPLDKRIETEIVEANAQNSADIQLAERKDVTRARTITTKLLAELEEMMDNPEAMDWLGEVMVEPDAQGRDKLNSAYRKVIAFPSRVAVMKSLTEALRTSVELERKVYKIDGTEAGEEIKNINVRFT